MRVSQPCCSGADRGGASGPTSVALPASECSRSMELAGRELDWRHQRHLWGQLHLPDQRCAAQASEEAQRCDLRIQDEGEIQRK